MTKNLRNELQFRKAQDLLKQNQANQIKAAEAERQRQIELQKKIAAEAAAGKSLSQIGRENFTGEGQAFQAGKTDQGGGVTKGKVQKSSSVPGGYYGSPRKDGGLINGYDDGGMVYLYDRQEMADGGEAESYADIIDAYENGVGVLEGCLLYTSDAADE